MKQSEASKHYMDAVRRWLLGKRLHPLDLTNREPDPHAFGLNRALGDWLKTQVRVEVERGA